MTNIKDDEKLKAEEAFYDLWKISKKDRAKLRIFRYNTIDNPDEIYYGFSLYIKYPETGIKFKPAKNGKGDDDSVILLKFHLDREPEEIKEARVTIACVSEYSMLKNHSWKQLYNYADEICPTKESLEKSEQSPQPAAFEINCFFNAKTKSFFYEDKPKKAITAIELINRIYDAHIASVSTGIKNITDKWFQFKFWFLKTFLINIMAYFMLFFMWLLKILYNKKLDFEHHKFDNTGLTYEKLKFKEAESIETPPIWGIIKLKINKRILFIAIHILIIPLVFLYLYYKLCGDDFSGIIKLIEANKENKVFLFCLLVLIFNYIIPPILTFLCKLFHKVCHWADSTNIKFNSNIIFKGEKYKELKKTYATIIKIKKILAMFFKNHF